MVLGSLNTSVWICIIKSPPLTYSITKHRCSYKQVSTNYCLDAEIQMWRAVATLRWNKTMYIIMLPRLHAGHRCHSCYTLYGTCQCWAHGSAVQTWLKRLWWSADLCKPKKPYIRRKSRSATGKGHFWVDLSRPIVMYLHECITHHPPLANVPAQRMRWMNTFTTVRGDKMVMWPFTKLLCYFYYSHYHHHHHHYRTAPN